ncbi:MAG: hypothetical protein K2H43_04125, partial [Clostridia bacterium]|nr:hypothetical protein [Clostridia bacterium]
MTGPADADLSGIPVSYAASAEGARTTLGTTDAAGKLIVSRAPITGYAFITAPEGFVYNEYYGNTESNPCPYAITERAPVRFTLIRHSRIEPALMTDAEKTAYIAAS